MTDYNAGSLSANKGHTQRLAISFMSSYIKKKNIEETKLLNSINWPSPQSIEYIGRHPVPRWVYVCCVHTTMVEKFSDIVRSHPICLFTPLLTIFNHTNHQIHTHDMMIPIRPPYAHISLWCNNKWISRLKIKNDISWKTNVICLHRHRDSLI